jgi:phosphoserine aminotransferase
MGDRIFNFSAGPATLPESVLKQAQTDIYDIFDSGIGILEHSHRGKVFDRITAETEAACREIANDPRRLRRLLDAGRRDEPVLHSCRRTCFPADRTADYFQTGKWANDSIKEAPLYGGCHICGSSKETNYSASRRPRRRPTPTTRCTCTSPRNNTIMGTEFHAEPDAAERGVPRVRRVEQHLQPADRRHQVRLDLRRCAEEPGPGGHHAGHRPQGPDRRARCVSCPT